MGVLENIERIREVIKQQKLDRDINALKNFFNKIEFEYITVENENWYEVYPKGFSFEMMWELLNLPTALEALKNMEEKQKIRLGEYLQISGLITILKKERDIKRILNI